MRRLAELSRESATSSQMMKNVLTQLGVEGPPWTGVELAQLIQRTCPSFQSMTRELNIQVE